MELIPEFLKDAFNRHYGDNSTRILAGLSMTRPVTLRVNTLKISSEQAKSALIKLGFKIKPVGFYADAFIIENAKESELQKTELYLRGEIYLQSLSSMLPPLL